jgi:hypothetical protein
VRARAVAWLKKHWRNGLRFQLAISALTLLGVASILIDQRGREDTAILALPEFEVVVERLVVERPVVGPQITYEREICNRSDRDVTVGIQRRLVAVDGGDEHVIAGSVTDPIPMGTCDTQERSFPIPDDLAAGDYVLRLVFSASLNGPYSSADSASFHLEGGQVAE